MSIITSSHVVEIYKENSDEVGFIVRPFARLRSCWTTGRVKRVNEVFRDREEERNQSEGIVDSPLSSDSNICGYMRGILWVGAPDRVLDHETDKERVFTGCSSYWRTDEREGLWHFYGLAFDHNLLRGLDADRRCSEAIYNCPSAVLDQLTTT